MLLRVTVEQKHGSSEMRFARLVEIVTDSHDIEGMIHDELDAISESDRDFVQQLHAARVELASLEPEHRRRAVAWLDEHSAAIELENEADYTRRAIDEVATEPRHARR